MRFLEQIAAASAFASLVFTAPTQDKRAVGGNKKFTVPQGSPRIPGKKIAGPIALARVYGKYAQIGASAPPKVDAAASAAAKADDGTVPADPQQFDQAYLSPVSVGGQTVNLDFDTGSSDLWVFSSELPTAQQTNHDIYNPDSSTTAKELNGETWSISYGDGSSASGNVYSDVVDVGGTSVTGQAVELAQKISSEFAQDLSDGLLGLAFSAINTVKPDQQKTFFDNATPQLSAPLFTANLKKGQPGSYNFGYIDDSQHTGEITYTAVDNSQGFWGFTATGYTVGSGAASDEDISAIADTGTSLLLLPETVVTAYYEQVSSAKNDQQQGGYTFDCDAALPNISFTIEGYEAVVPGSFINYAPLSEGSSTCFGGLQSSAGVGVNIFGDVFLKAQFVVFENEGNGPRLGFAAKDL